MILNSDEIIALIKNKGLIQDFIDLETQLSPNGFDLTVKKVFQFDSCGALDFSNKERVVPQGKEITPKKKNKLNKFGWWHLQKGAYKIRTNELVNLPCDLIALGYCRSSLLRMGAFTQNAVWDAGFRGRSEFILVVANPKGIRLKENARLIQLIFLRIPEVSCGYTGIYKE